MSLVQKIVIAGFLAFATGSLAHGIGSDHTHTDNEPGIETAQVWLELVDLKKYAASWQTAAPVFKTAITSEQWEATVKNVREPLGDLIKRSLYHDRFTTTMAGMPDGEYLILRFVTRYANKQSAVETVTVMKDETDTWRVAGYFIK